MSKLVEAMEEAALEWLSKACEKAVNDFGGTVIDTNSIFENAIVVDFEDSEGMKGSITLIHSKKNGRVMEVSVDFNGRDVDEAEDQGKIDEEKLSDIIGSLYGLCVSPPSQGGPRRR